MSIMTESVSVGPELGVAEVDTRRCRLITKTANFRKTAVSEGAVLYWMSRDQRIQNNWAMIYAQQLANKFSVPLMICFCLVPKFLEATIRHYGFMMKGLQEAEHILNSLNIPFHLLLGEAREKLPPFVQIHSVSTMVCDFSPLRVPLAWVKAVAVEMDKVKVPIVQVDAHNVVPCWVASDKLEYAARTIRAKIHRLLPEFLVEFPSVEKQSPLPTTSGLSNLGTDWRGAEESLEVNREVGEVEWCTPGTAAGMATFQQFCKKKLKTYHLDRNNPNKNGLSNLSPWLHFGQISIQECVLLLKKEKTSSTKESIDTFIEEAVIRRELSDNFCFYCNDYDKITGAYSWAQETLRLHASDKREYLYTEEELEKGHTHDKLWNACQLQMVREGKMHGYMRMYWAKKILEWTLSPEEALRIAIKLNDKYELDGRDPNGYVGCMWSICGIHDRGWTERKVFGKIRFMNYNGCKRKFDVAAFEAKYPSTVVSTGSQGLGGTAKAKSHGKLRKREEGQTSLQDKFKSKKRKTK